MDNNLRRFIVDSDIYDWATSIIEDPNNFNNAVDIRVIQAQYTALLNTAAGALLLHESNRVNDTMIARSMHPNDIRTKHGWTDRAFEYIFKKSIEKLAWEFEHFVMECQRLKNEAERVLNVSYIILAILSPSTQGVEMNPDTIQEIAKKRRIVDPYSQTDPADVKGELFLNPDNVGLSAQHISNIVIAFHAKDPSMLLDTLNTAANIPIQSTIFVPADPGYQLQLVENLARSLRQDRELYPLADDLDSGIPFVRVLWDPTPLYEKSPHMDILYYFPEMG
uniref:Uncharacterized protein n=1 Tax=viral metagenome TaxID=1070528 RepID=A0A6C0LTD0_9ZZZZ